MGVAISVSVSN